MTQITIAQWLSSQSTPSKGAFMPTTQSLYHDIKSYLLRSSMDTTMYSTLTQENVRLVETFVLHVLLSLPQQVDFFPSSITLLFYHSKGVHYG